MSLRSLVLGSILAALVGGATVPAQDAARADAVNMQRKLLAIAARGEVTPAETPAPLRTSFTDREVNAFFKVNATDVVPDGIIDPVIAIDEGGRVQARAQVDLQAAAKPKQRTWLDPLAWLPAGRMDVTATGVLQTADGKGRFAIESATLGGANIPKSVLQELVNYYTRTPENPAGVNLDAPFDLPANIKAVETRRGTATVVQ